VLTSEVKSSYWREQRVRLRTGGWNWTKHLAKLSPNSKSGSMAAGSASEAGFLLHSMLTRPPPWHFLSALFHQWLWHHLFLLRLAKSVSLPGNLHAKYDMPHTPLFEAGEFLQQNMIQVIFDYIQMEKNQFPEKTGCTDRRKWLALVFLKVDVQTFMLKSFEMVWPCVKSPQWEPFNSTYENTECHQERLRKINLLEMPAHKQNVDVGTEGLFHFGKCRLSMFTCFHVHTL